MALRSTVIGRPVAAGVVGLTAVLAACSSDGAPAPTAESYLAELGAVCTATATSLDALPDPPDGITVADFADQASSILRDEAEAIRTLTPPDDLADDQRALIRNDEEQSAAWSDVSDAASAAGAAGVDRDALNELTTTIAQLNFGRDDLVAEMGAPSCARTAE